jgi:hypothetical protein
MGVTERRATPGGPVTLTTVTAIPLPARGRRAPDRP